VTANLAGPAFRRLPRAVREQQILDAAVRVFSRRGYHAASVDEISEAAAISKPMIYAYLGTKEELFLACLNREGARLIEALATAAAGAAGDDLGPDQKLRRGLRAFFGFVAAHRDGWKVLYGQARGQELFAEVLAQMRDRMADLIIGMLASASADAGRVANPDELTTMGYALVGASEALADWLVDHPAEDPDTTAARLTTTLWQGVGSLLA
jgi:AcrR family transcriptional regulator